MTRGGDVVPFYASEPAILSRDDIAATRVRFALGALAALRLRAARARLALSRSRTATRRNRSSRRARAANADAVYWNDEYEPALRARDDAVERALRAAGVRVKRFHDRLLVPPGAVATKARAGRSPCTRRSAGRARRSTSRRRCPAPARLAPNPLPARPPATLERLGFAAPAAAPWPAGEREARARLERFTGGRNDEAGHGLASYVAGRDVLAEAVDLAALGRPQVRHARHPPRARRRAARPRPPTRAARAGREVRRGAALARLLRARALALPARRARRVPARVRRAPLERRPTRTSTRGATAAPATPSWTPACASCSRPGSCTTARA